jgi:hypothetical protein
MKTTAQIDISAVTGEQIGRCHKVYDEQARAWFYLVESERDLFNEANERIEYAVRWSKERGFICTCPAGQDGFSRCAAGVCKHVVWSLACEREVRSELARMAARIDEERDMRAASCVPVAPAAPVLLIDGKPATDEELARVLNAPVKPVDRRAHPIAARPFSILR